jgi:cobalamin biosynthesis protein CobD/CbiB
MGVKLGQPLHLGGQWQERGEFGLGEEPDAEHIESANSLIWRGLVVWLAVALLGLIAGWAT